MISSFEFFKPKNLLSVEKTFNVSVVSLLAETVSVKVFVSIGVVVCSSAKTELLVKNNKENKIKIRFILVYYAKMW